MIDRINHDVYDFVQPDASVIGGIGAVMEVFSTAKQKETDVVVHAWGGPVAIMACYPAAFAGGGRDPGPTNVTAETYDWTGESAAAATVTSS